MEGIEIDDLTWISWGEAMMVDGVISKVRKKLVIRDALG